MRVCHWFNLNSFSPLSAFHFFFLLLGSQKHFFFQCEETWVLPRAGNLPRCNLDWANALTCMLSSHVTAAATGFTEPTPSVFVFSCRYLHRTFLVKSGTTLELYPVSFKFRPDHWCHLVPVKVRIFSGLARQAGAP